MAKKKEPISPTRLKKVLREHIAKKFTCLADGEPLEYQGYVVTDKGTVITDWLCPNGHLRHMKILE